MRLAYVDALRGLAALYVVIHHVFASVYGTHQAYFGVSWTATALAPFVYGRAGVDLFLVISGFVLFQPVVTGARPIEPLGRFLLRRAWRLVPPYWAAIALTLAALLAWPALAAVLPGAAPLRWETVATHLLLVHNLGPMRDLYALVPPWWTIPMEYQLYAAFPLLALAVRRFGMPGMVAGALALTIAGRVGLPRLSAQLGIENVLANSVPGMLGLFAIGMGVAHLTHQQAFAGRGRTFAGLAALGFGAGVALWQTNAYAFYLFGDLAWGLGAGALLLAGRDALGWLRHPALVAMGGFSYSTYLIHYPLLAAGFVLLAPLGLARWQGAALMLALGVPLILLASWAFHRAFERPFLGRPPWLRAASAC